MSDPNNINLSLMKGKKGVIMGVANDHSIAWGIAQSLSAAGAELAFSYQSETLKKRVEPLAKMLGSDLIYPCDVESSEDIEIFFNSIQNKYKSNMSEARSISSDLVSESKNYSSLNTKEYERNIEAFDQSKKIELKNKSNTWIKKCSNVLSSRTAMELRGCLLYTSPSPRDRTRSRMPSSA